MNNPHVPYQNCKFGLVKQRVSSELTDQKQIKEKEGDEGDGDQDGQRESAERNQ